MNSFQANGNIRKAVALIAALSSGICTAEKNVTETAPVFVSATRTELSLEKLGRSTTLLSEEYLENSQQSLLRDVLFTVPGMDVRSYGPFSNTTRLSIRGMQSYHTRMMINGIPLQDVSTPQVTPAFADLTLDGVQQIEIVRGGHSTLFGSNAIAGVVNVITKNGEGEPQGTIGAEVGSSAFHRVYGTLNGSSQKTNYMISSSYLSDNGIDVLGADHDHDGFRNQSHLGTFGLILDENWKLNLLGRYATSQEEYDNSFGPDNEWATRTITAGASLEGKHLMDMMDLKLYTSVNDTQRRQVVSGDLYDGTTLLYGLQNSVTINPDNILTFGYEHESQYAENMDSWGTDISVRHRTDAIFLQHEAALTDNLFLTLGGRFNSHSEFGKETTWSSSLAWLLEETGTKFHTSYATGFRSPSLYELYGPYGNADLDPETSSSFDIGFEQTAADSTLTFGSTWFRNRTEDAIDWSFTTFAYGQISGIKTSGLESFINWQPNKDFSMKLTHTYTHTNNMENESSLIYVPRHKASLVADYRCPSEKAVLQVAALYNGSTETDAEDIEDGLLINTSLTCKVNDSVEIYGRIENLLNENYDLIRTYNTRERTFFFGTKLSF